MNVSRIYLWIDRGCSVRSGSRGLEGVDAEAQSLKSEMARKPVWQRSKQLEGKQQRRDTYSMMTCKHPGEG
jgi:hypothetical protein